MVGGKTSTAGLFRRSLSDLPDDLLEPITGYLHYLDIANLTFVGCKALNAKLTCGGVSQLTVRFVPSPKPFSWPSIWTQLAHLSKLTLSNFRLGAELVMTSNWLRLLPKTLKEFRSDFAGTFSALQPLLCENPNFFPTLEVLKILIGLKDTFSDGVVPVWPPTLLKLTLDSTVVHNMPLYLSSLPKSLTSFRGSYTDIRDASSATFPASLTSIQLSAQKLDCDVVFLLPVGLKRLLLAGGFDPQQSWDERHANMEKWKNLTAQLPRGLTSLSWHLDICDTRVIQNLPPNLEKLQGGLIDPTLWHLLPDSITSCSACSIASNPAGREVIEHVPKNLTRLSLTVSALPHFKTNLKSGVTVMAVRAFDGLKEEMSALNMDRLNSGITTLLCYVPLEDVLLEVLPSNLTTLWLGFHEIRDDQVAMLPRTLKRLHLLKGDLEERTGAFFPPQLTHLTVARMKPSSWFPRTLLQLQVNSGADLPLEALQDLPPGLQILSFPLSWDVLPSAPTSVPCIAFPKTLAELSVTMDKTQLKTTERLCNLVSSLPQNLEFLQFYISGFFPCADIPFSLLPRRLTDLILPKKYIRVIR